MKYIFMVLVLVIPEITNAQFIDYNPHRHVYKANAVKRIDKFLVINDSSQVRERLVSTTFVNKYGYSTQSTNYNKDNVVDSASETFYMADSILLKSIYTIYRIPTNDTSTTEFMYNKSFSQLDKLAFYHNDILVAQTAYKYNKNGSLKSSVHISTFHNTPKKTTKRITKRKYIYNSDGKCYQVHYKSNMGKNKTFFKIYDTQNNLIENFVQYHSNSKEFLNYKYVYDSNNNLICEERFHQSNTTNHLYGKSFKMKKGEGFKTCYIYDVNGLIDSEVMSALNNSSEVLKYKYYH